LSGYRRCSSRLDVKRVIESPDLLAIGEVARESGKAASAIRYYEQIGLLPEPVRIAGRRRYGRDVIRTLAVIETAQRGGLTLDEIRLLLEASPDDGAATERLRHVAERKLPELDALFEPGGPSTRAAGGSYDQRPMARGTRLTS
jgi:DNA-binding transcriptional MerR regulator